MAAQAFAQGSGRRPTAARTPRNPAAEQTPTVPDAPAQSNVTLSMGVNGEPLEVSFAPYRTLLEVLREDCNLPGTKHGCELGECGACAVLLDGEPVLSCLVVGVECDGREVTTVEGLGCDGQLHP